MTYGFWLRYSSLMTRDTLPMNSPLGEYQVLSAVEAGKLLRKSRERIAYLIKHGELSGYMDSGRYVIPLASIREYQDTRRAALGADIERARKLGHNMMSVRQSKAA